MKKIFTFFAVAALLANIPAKAVNTVSFTVNHVTFCQNDYAHFTNTSTSPHMARCSFTWDMGATSSPFNSYAFNPPDVTYWSAGSPTVWLSMYDSTDGSTISYHLVLTVWAVPNITGVTPWSPMLGCGTDSVVLSATSSIPATIVWQRPSLLFDTAASITANVAGAYTARAVSSHGCANLYPSTVFIGTYPAVTAHINVYPTATTAGDTLLVCKNSSPFISGYWSGGTYPVTSSWSSSSSGTSFPLTASGEYKFTVEDMNGCIDSAKTYVKIINIADTTITSSATGPLCFGDTVMLTAPAGYTYNWYMTGSHEQSIKAFWSGTYTVQIVDSLGCTATSSPITLNFVMPPYPNVNVTACLMTVTVPDVSNTYQWYSGFTPIPGATSPFFTAYEPGFYAIKETRSGCTGTSPYVVSNCVTGIDGIAKPTGITAFPNPFNENFTVQFEDKNEHTVIMYDILGKEIVREEGNEVVKINPSVPAGMYFIVAKNSDGSTIFKEKMIRN